MGDVMFKRALASRLQKHQAEEILFGNLNSAKDSANASIDDMQRWFHQGFQFCRNPNFGLQQQSGGPCGILAVVQSEIVKYIFMEIYSDIATNDDLVIPEDELLLVSLAKALQMILCRAASRNEVSLVLPMTPIGNISSILNFDIEIWTMPAGEECFEFIFNNIHFLQSDVGCILFALSLIFTRGIEDIKRDMDVESNSLVGRFGHTTQELMNLLLIGKASSNAFDGDVELGDSGLTLKGVPSQSSVGYMTHLESLGLCQVGDYYKYPDFPIWVIGGSSHFSLMFTTDRTINERTSMAEMLTIVKRAFTSVDTDSCGFIPTSKLAFVLKSTGLDVAIKLANSKKDLSTLERHLQVEGDIIIWGNLWQTLSTLLSGGNIDDVTRTMNARARSDSEVAREMQYAFDRGMDADTWSNMMEVDNVRMRSDSEIARDLQASFNEQQVESMSLPGQSTPTQSNENDKTIATKEFTMFYFNGLDGAGRCPVLAKFKLLDESEIDEVGKQVAMTSQGKSSNICPIEEVMRTRWPNAKFDWMGQNIPTID